MPFAGAATLSKFGGYDSSIRWISGDDDDSRAAWVANPVDAVRRARATDQ